MAFSDLIGVVSVKEAQITERNAKQLLKHMSKRAIQNAVCLNEDCEDPIEEHDIVLICTMRKGHKKYMFLCNKCYFKYGFDGTGWTKQLRDN